MTNTIYFNLDDASYSTSSPDSILSQQQGQEGSVQLENNSIVFSKASSSSVVVTAGAINALIHPPSWRNREQVRKPDQDFSSNTSPFTSPSEGEISPSSNLKSFSFKELNTATNNFSPDYVLEEGGFGKVFKGWINEHKLTATKPGWGTAVSIKRLRQESSQGRKELLEEINFLGKLCHPNLVKLLGYCLHHEERLLVYEFTPRGGLENHLFRSDSCFQLLSWNLRMKFALGASKGLSFIHGAERKVIYGDLKTSNILLDWNYNAKLSDFGLADGPTGDKRHVSTWVMGTYGYAAPEYLATGHLTAKSDVYSFGVVLLEMLSGFRAVDKNRPPGEHGLVEWVKPYLNHKRKISRVLDRRLKGKYPLAGAQKAALALHCLSMEAKFRPNMDEVVKALEELQDSKIHKKVPLLRRPEPSEPTQ